MISAPNRLLPLNGNNFLILVLVLSGIWSCTTPKQAVKKTPPPPAVVEPEEMVRVYDPVSKSYILVPKDAIEIDTLQWTVDPTPPVLTDSDTDIVRKPEKDRYEIGLLIPLDAQGSNISTEPQDPRIMRFIQYYAGVSLAMQQIDSAMLPVRVRSFDIGGAGNTVDKVLKRTELSSLDVIVGPYERSDIEKVAIHGLNNEIMVVSPWIPAFPVSRDNPFLIHLFPGLQTHADAILSFIANQMRGKKVYVVARDNAGELGRIQLFTKHPEVMTDQLIVKDTTPDLLNTDLNLVLHDSMGTIFIMPYFSKSDEPFVNAFMRKLHADRGTREAIVFGLPQWIGFNNLNPNYMESLSLHISASSFMDSNHPAYKSFRKRFFKQYHIVPDIHAFQGYDMMMWLAQRLKRGGQEGMIGIQGQDAQGMSFHFDIQPVFKEDSGIFEMNTPLYYENKGIRILKFVNQDYIIQQ